MPSTKNQSELMQLAQYYVRASIVAKSVAGSHLSTKALEDEDTSPRVMERIIKNVSEKSSDLVAK